MLFCISQPKTKQGGTFMISREDLSELIAFNPEHYLTTTLYLRIDKTPQLSHTITLKDLMKMRRKELESQDLTPEVQKCIESDFKKIQDYVNLKFTRNGVQTLVIFSNSGVKFWKVVIVNIPMRDLLVIQPRPLYRPLSFILNEHKRFLFILIERAKARLLEIYAGEILERSEILDDVPNKVRVGGYGGYEERKIERHIEDHVRQHFKHVADAAYDFSRKYSNDHLIIGGTDQNTNEFRQYLHSTFGDRITTILHENFAASPSEILQQTLNIEKQLREREESRLITRLFDEVNSGGLGVVGLDPILVALQVGQINQLLVQEGFQKEGFRCKNCGSLHLKNGACAYCGEDTANVPDVVEEAIQDAIEQGCQVRYLSRSHTQLTSAGNIGALLRFKT
jgi:peptide subunit release factor 1 (eRF1)